MLGMPVMVLGVVALVLAALVLAVAAVAGIAYGVSGFSALLHTYTGLADRLAAGGISLSAFVLGIMLLMLGSRILQRVIPSFVKTMIGNGNSGRGEEAEK